MNLRLAVLAVLFGSIAPVLAQIPTVNENYCLAPPDGTNPMPQRCTFATLAECEAAKQSEAERCMPNPHLTFPEPEDKLFLPRDLRQ